MKLLWIAAALAALATPASAQTPGAALDAAMKAQADALAANEAADAAQAASDKARIDGLVGSINAALSADSLIVQRLDALDARVKTLEAASAPPQPTPGPTPPPPPTPDPTPNPPPPAPVASGDLLLGGGFWQHNWQCDEPHNNVLAHNLMFDPNVSPAIGTIKTKIAAGELSPQTGVITLKPGESYSAGPVFDCRAFNARDNGAWVLKFAATGTASASLPGFAGSAGRLVGNVTPTTSGALTFAGGASGGTIRFDYLGPQAYEADPKGVRAAAVKNLKSYGVFRPMDWMSPNGCRMYRAAQWIEDGAAFVQLPCGVMSGDARDRAGYQFADAFRVAGAAQAALWVNLPATLGAESVKGALDGYSGDWNGRTVLFAPIAANIQTILSSARTEYRALCVRLAKSAKAAGYNDATPLYVELGNELWNLGGIFGVASNYMRAISLALGKPEDHGRGAGAMHAIMVEECDAAFRAEKPAQKLVYPFSVQTATLASINQWTAISQAVTSMREAEAARGVPIRAKTLIATTGYYYGTLSQAFQLGSPASTSQGPNAALVAQLNRNAVAFARDNGLAGAGQYEGSLHEYGNSAFASWIVSPEAEAVQGWLIDQFRAAGVNPIANYMLTGKRLDQNAPWVETTISDDVCAAPKGAAAAWCARGRKP